MATNDNVLRAIKPGDRKRLAELELSPSEISLVYSYWYKDYVALLKDEGRRFPGTATDIAIEAFGREEDRQHLYKNPHISSIHKEYLDEIGKESRSTKIEKTREEALTERADQLDATNSNLQTKLDTSMEEIVRLTELVKKLERELEWARKGQREEKAAIDHLFETGRRVLL